MKVDKNPLLYKVYIKAKQKCWSSYKIEQLWENISEELHFDMMGPITLTEWNRYKYSLIIINDYSRCRWVENIYKKYKATFHLKQFVTFIKKQTWKSIKYLWLD